VRLLLPIVLAVLTVAVCCCICFSHKYADAAVEHFALGLVATCCSVYGVQGASMTDNDHSLTYTAHNTQCNKELKICQQLPAVNSS
jgi:hypothetical protein